MGTFLGVDAAIRDAERSITLEIYARHFLYRVAVDTSLRGFSYDTISLVHGLTVANFSSAGCRSRIRGGSKKKKKKIKKVAGEKATIDE